MNRLQQILADRRFQIIVTMLVVWGVMFPEDIEHLVAPIKAITGAIPTGLYALVGIGVASWAYRSVHIRERM